MNGRGKPCAIGTASVRIRRTSLRLCSRTPVMQGGLAVDEELTYRLERCIYLFFISALSVFESFGFCVYFLGSALEDTNFPYFSNPKKITLAVTSTAFTKSFPDTEITSQLAELLQAPEYTNIDALRNILAHRVSGRRSVRGQSSTNADGTIWHSTEESWHIPGSSEVLIFDEEMLNRYLHKLTKRIYSLVSAARQFAQNCQSTGEWPR